MRRFSHIRNIQSEGFQFTVYLFDSQTGKLSIHGGIELVVHLIFQFKRHKSDLIPFVHQLTYDLHPLVFTHSRIDGLNFFYNTAFFLEILRLFVVTRRILLFLLFEEIIAIGSETLPGNFRLLGRHDPDGFPFFLNVDHLLRRVLPIGTVFQRLGAFTQRHFLLQILLHFVVHRTEELVFVAEKEITRRAVTTEYLGILFPGGLPYFTPFLL